MSSSDQDRTRVPKASGVLATDLRARIIRQRLPEGHPLDSESDLIASSGLSRASVREALRLLESEGIITTRRGPGGGIRVSRPDLDTSTRSIAMILALSGAPLRELFELRAVLETRAAELAAANATLAQIREMDAAVAAEGSQLPDMMSFHSLIARSCGNEFLAVILEIVHSLAEWHTPLEALPASDLELAIQAHRKIVSMISARDAEGAGLAMLAHIRGFEALLQASDRLGQPVIRAEDWDTRP